MLRNIDSSFQEILYLNGKDSINHQDDFRIIILITTDIVISPSLDFTGQAVFNI